MSGLSAESLSASGRSSEKLSLPLLQSKMKCDPEGYESELVLLYSQFNSSLELFQQQAALNFTSISGIGNDPTVAKDLGDRAMFLSHVSPFYPKHLADFPKKLVNLISSAARSLPSGLRHHLTQALILTTNRKLLDFGETLPLFMELQTLGDKTLRKLAFSHVIQSIRHMNQKHKNEVKNRALQNVLFSILQQEDEARARRSLITLCELHRRKVWFDDRTGNAICTASFHTSSRIMIAALSFLLDYEKIENDDDSDASSSEDDLISPSAHVVLSKESVYKAHHKGTVASKKKKKAKLQRAMRSMKRQQRLSSENSNFNYYSPLNHLKDAQGFVEKLFSRLQSCNETYKVKMMMVKVIARTIGLHRLMLLNFYPFLQKYVKSHQPEVLNLLAAAVQACHEMIPTDVVEPLFKQIVNQFVHDRSRPEAITVGLNTVREICMRMPLLMTEDLLQDLTLYKKSHEKAVSIAARSLITLFRELYPSLLVKKDRGRPTDPKARPKAYGEASVSSNVPGLELLQNDDNDDEQDASNSNESMLSGSDDDDQMTAASDTDDKENQLYDDDTESGDDGVEENDDLSENEDDDDNSNINDDGDDNEEEDGIGNSDTEEKDGVANSSDIDTMDRKTTIKNSGASKRKFSDFSGQVITADASLRALKKLAGATVEPGPSESTDGFLSNEDFQKIKELKAKEKAKTALHQHGLTKSIKVPSFDKLNVKPVDPAKLEVHVRKKLSKEQRLELVRAGREERGKYQARAAVKQKKTGGLSNKQKEHKKKMPQAAKREKVGRSRLEKRKKQQRQGKQFRGRKAWK
ncbi:Protein SDA1 [Quillaja saponaria]|uniref:Protein SDA1 n=1 Tax=Quillaja saponaria TaxID=32244 RepID=A0AAD7P810_QUISA|nr:Protein SDA1 [Quillaja saponaria]